MGQCAKGIAESEYNEDKYHLHAKDDPIPSHLTWSEITNAIEHELYPRIAHEISNIIKKHDIKNRAIYYTESEEKGDETKQGIEFIIDQIK